MPLRKLSLGMELEACALGSNTRQRIAEAINDAALGPRARASETGPAPGEAEWLVIPEPNVNLRSHPEHLFTPHAGVELVSPVFIDESESTTKAWKKNVSDVTNAIRNKEGLDLIVYESCGYHVHVGVGLTGVFTLDEIKSTACIVVLYEGTINTLHPRHQSGRGNVNEMLRPMGRRSLAFQGMDEHRIV